MGKILAICTSPKRGTVKTEVPSAVLTPEWGIVSDAHGGSWHRQVSLLSAEKIEAFRRKIWVDYGAFGENLVIEGFDFRNLPVTSRFAIGDVVLEMTQIGKECHNDCVIKQQTGECIMPREGVFARVLTGGEIHVGDEVALLPPLENPPLRAAVITLSDKGSRGEREDKSGPLIVEMLTAAGGEGSGCTGDTGSGQKTPTRNAMVIHIIYSLFLVKQHFISTLRKRKRGGKSYLRAHSPSRPAAIRTPCSRLGRMYSRFSFTALGLPGRLTMSVLPRSTLAPRLSIPRGVMLRL